jgi:hypothetical protein
MSNLIINIPDEEREKGQTKDSIKYNKDCADFQCLDDGTITRECRYCNLSLMCRQTDVLPNGKVVPMEANFLPVFNDKGELIEYQLFCTGMHDLRDLKERIEDDKVS